MPLPVSALVPAVPRPALRRRRSRHQKVALVVAGFALVVAGVLGGILPVVPGTPLVLGGLALVTTHSPRGRLFRTRGLRWLKDRGILERLGFLTRWFPGLSRTLRLTVEPRRPRLDQPALVAVTAGERSASTTFRA